MLALLDTGSPISIIKVQFISPEFINPLNNDQSWTGLNNSRLNVIGTYESTVFFENYELSKNIKFYVVPDETMNQDIILGRDFIHDQNFNFTFGETVDIVRIKKMLIVVLTNYY